MPRSAWIPNSTDIWLEKEELIVSTVWLLYWYATKSGSWNFVFIITFFFITVNRIKELHKVTVRIPPDNEKSNLIRIEGDPQGVQEAKKELLELASRMVSTNPVSKVWCCKLDLHEPLLKISSLVGEWAYKGPDHWTAFSQSHHWPKRGEDKRSAGQIPRGELETVCWCVCTEPVNLLYFDNNII